LCKYDERFLKTTNKNVYFLRNRIRACINILGDAYGAAIIESMSRKELDKLPIEAPNDVESPKEQSANSNGNAISHKEV
jgi:hypothetical protein